MHLFIYEGRSPKLHLDVWVNYMHRLYLGLEFMDSESVGVDNTLRDLPVFPLNPPVLHCSVWL